jgi:ribosome-associated protein
VLTFDAVDLLPWLDVRFDRAAGPGGQNVNKVNTRATLLFDFEGCALLTDVQRSRIRSRLQSRMSADGRLRVVAQDERTQLANRRSAEARLLELIAQAVHQPKSRRPTRPSAGSKRRRRVAKEKRGETKRLRRPPRE